MESLKHISLCAGYGGIDMGLSAAIGFVETVAYSEIEAFPIANLLSKIEHGLLDPAPIWSDLKTFPWAAFRDKVDILSGGFPCQPFSAAGHMRADEDPRHLWPYIVKGVKELNKPPILFFENVENLLASDLKGEHWSDPQGTPIGLHIFRELERLEYNVTAGVFSAKEVGASQQRNRVFILAIHSSLSKKSREFITENLSEKDYAYAGFRVLSKRTIEQAWPNTRDLNQFDWEPPRILARDGNPQIPVPQQFGEDYAKACVEFLDLRLEIKMLGNGVVPATAERAFNILWAQLNPRA